jgi:LysM repeat protein
MKLNSLEGKTVREIEASLKNKNRKTQLKSLLLLVMGAALIILSCVIWHQNTVLARQKAANDMLAVENKTLKEEINILKEKLAGYQVVNELPQNELYLYYEIKPGDTLGKISQQYFGTDDHASRLAKLNGLTVEATLQVGQVIKLPKKLN